MNKKIKFKFNLKFFIVFISIMTFILTLDLLSKHFLEAKILNIINGVISFKSTHNYGAAWSVLSEHTNVLIIISSIFIVLILFSNFYIHRKNLLYYFGFSLIIAGAIGNLIDRLIFGYVRDFIKLDFFPSFPIFNVADVSLTIGVFIYALFMLLSELKREKKNENKSKS